MALFTHGVLAKASSPLSLPVPIANEGLALPKPTFQDFKRLGTGMGGGVVEKQTGAHRVALITGKEEVY